MLHLEIRQPMPTAVLPIPEGDAGTEATIAAMRALIDEGRKDPVVHELAARILRRARVAAFDWTGEVRAIYEAVRRNVRFTRDIRGRETLHAAREIIRLQIGDCDDFTILLCSLLETVGGKTRIVTVSSDARDPGVFTHVFPEVKVGDRWIAVDAARRQPGFGKRPRYSFRTRFWDTQSPDFVETMGLNGLSTQTTPGRLPLARRPTTAPWFQSLGGLGRASQVSAARVAAAGMAAPRRKLGQPARTYGAPQGQGRYGNRALRGLGQDTDFDFSQLETELPSIISATSGLVVASRAAPQNLVAVTSPGGTTYGAPSSSGLPSTILGMPTGTVLIGAGILVAAIMISRSQS